MKNIPNIKVFYTRIQHQLYTLIPEKCESIYLYASIIKQSNTLETWEMYFYYTPKSLIKRNPINVYEIPTRFNVEEQEYLKLVDNLCNTIKKLYAEYKETYEKDWTNIVISIKDYQFLIEYNDNNLLNSKYSSQDRHIIFKHKYLNIPLQSFNNRQKQIIKEYLNNEEYGMSFDRYFEYIPDFNTHNYIEYGIQNEQDIPKQNQLAIVKKKKFRFFDIFKRKQEIVKQELTEPKIQILSNKF